ncbi:MAG: PAS domain S-box protein [Spirulina sp.]
MPKDSHLQRQLEEAQSQIQQLSQQLVAERDAARQIQAQLQGQLDQQQRDIAQLEHQANRLRWIINTSPAVTYTCQSTPPYAYTYASPSLAVVLGYSPDDVQAEPNFWVQHLHPDDAPGVLAVIPQVFDQGKLQHDYRVRHRDGHYVWIRDVLTLRRNAQGEPQEVVGYVTDISDQKRLEAERQRNEQRIEQERQRIAQENCQFRETLKAQEATYRHLFDCNPQPMWVYDLATLQFLAVNEAAVAKYGYSRAEFLAMTIADIRPPEEVPRLLDNIAQVDSGLDIAGVWSHCLRDGQRIQVEIVSHTLEFEGRRAELVMAQDVTDRIRVEQALRYSEERYRLFVELAPHLIWSADGSGRNVYVSTRMGEYLGLPTEQLVNFDWPSAVHPDDAERVRDGWMESVRTGMPYETECRMRRGDGAYRWHLIQAVCVQCDQEMQWLGMATDIHDRKQAELALQDLNQSLEQKVTERTADLYRSQTEVRVILNNSPAKIYVEDLEGRYIFVNQTFLRLFNCQLEEVIGKTTYEFFPPEIADTLRTNDLRLLEQGGVQQFEEIVQINGEERCFLSNKFLLRDDQGEAYALCGMSTDITNRKAMEVALQSSYDHLQAMLAALPDHVFRVNREGVYLDFYPSDSILEIAGLDTLVGHRMVDVLPPDLAQAHLHRIEQALNTQTVQVSEQSLAVDGTQLVREVRVAPCGPNDVLFVIRDITDRKHIEAQVNRQLAAIEAAVDGIAILQDDVFVYLNRAHLELFGYHQAEDLIGQPWTVLYGPEEQARFEREVVPTLARDGAWVGEVIATRQDGTTFDEGLSLTLAENGLMICVCEDLGDRKQIEARNQQLLQELAGFKLALDASAIVSVTDAQGVIIDVNDKFCTVSGYSRQELIGKTHRLVNSRHHSPYYFRDLWRTIASGQVWRGEICNRAKDGTPYWVDSTMVPFLGSQGRPERYLSIQFDVTDRKQAEIELRDLTSRLTLALEAGDYGIWDWDLVHDAIWDERMYEIYGLQDLDRPVTYQDWRDQVHPDDLDAVEAQLQAAVQDKVTFNVEFRIVRPDGELRWLRSITSTQYDTEGNPLRIVGISYDNTDRKQAEQDLLASENRFRRVFSSNIVGMMFTDFSGQIFDANDRFLTLLGYTRTELETQAINWTTLTPPEHQANDIKAIEELRRSGAIDPWEKEYFRKDGSRVAVLIGVAMLDQADGQCVCVVFDISDRKRVESQLQSSQAYFQSIVADQTELICRFLPDGTLTFVNNAYCQFVQKSPDQLLGQSFMPLLPEEDQDISATYFSHLSIENPVVTYEHQVVAPDGLIHWQQWTGRAFFGADGSPIEFQSVGRDITTLKEAEAQLRYSNQELQYVTRLKDEFLANMSHELRTPLNAILGMTEGLQEGVFGPLTDRQKRSLNTIERSGTHLLSLINDILDLSKIEAGQIDLDYTAVSVGFLCRSSLTFLQEQAHRKNLQFQTHIPAHLPDLYGDERRLCQVLINLLSNAVKFTPEGGQITVMASYRPLAGATLAPHQAILHPEGDPAATVGILTLSVADTGIGISPENAERLFQPFVQIDSALNRQHQGTGLGLALVKRITELHGGTVTLTSEVGSGSCFTLQLPIIPIPSDDCPTPIPLVALEGSPGLAPDTPPLILLAEDNEANVDTITAYLGAKGYKLIVAKDGLEAISLATRTNPDLILMDIQMPQMDGLAAIRQLRQTPDLVSVPIVALTALAMPEDRDHCLAAGANAYISKPIRLKHLAQIIQTLLAPDSTT